MHRAQPRERCGREISKQVRADQYAATEISFRYTAIRWNDYCNGEDVFRTKDELGIEVRRILRCGSGSTKYAGTPAEGYQLEVFHYLG